MFLRSLNLLFYETLIPILATFLIMVDVPVNWQYQRAVSKALVDRIPDENASTQTVVRFICTLVSIIYQLVPALALEPFICVDMYFLTSSFVVMQVLMVVGAGRGPLVRASLQVFMFVPFDSFEIKDNPNQPINK